MHSPTFRVSVALVITLLLMTGLFVLVSGRSAAGAAPPEAPADPLAPEAIIDIEWERVYSGTLDGVLYSGLYWGGVLHSRVALADLDADGDLDALLGGHGPGQNHLLHFFRNTGTAAAPIWDYVTEEYVEVAYQTGGPVFADIDADGDLDLFVGIYERIAFYENTGSPTTPAWEHRTDTYAGLSVEDGHPFPSFGDIDDDNDLDLFVGVGMHGDTSSIYYYRNDGSPTNAAWTLVTDSYNNITTEEFIHPVLADINADGDLDLFVGLLAQLRYYENTGNASTPAWTFITDAYVDIPFRFAVTQARPTFADLDDDDDLDLLLGHGGGWVVHYENTGSAASAAWNLTIMDTFPLDQDFSTRPALSDIDADDDLDLFLGTGYGPGGGDIHFLRNDGTLAEPSWTYIGDQYAGIDRERTVLPAFGDIDADGDQDLFVGGYGFFAPGEGTIHFYENTGTPLNATWTLISDTYAGINLGEHAMPTLADIDGDGDLDLFVSQDSDPNESFSVDTTVFYRNDGNATTPAWTHVTDDYGDDNIDIIGNALAFADVDGDGDLDCFTERSLYRNDGNATTPAWTLVDDLDIAWTSYPPILGDLLGNDGRPDLLLGGQGGLLLYRNVGDLPPQVSSVAPADGGSGLRAGAIVVEFDNAMAEATLDGANIEVVGSASGAMAGGVLYDAGSRQWFFKPQDTYVEGEMVQVTVKAAITDDSGHGLDGNGNGISEGSPADDYAWSFGIHDRQSIVVGIGHEPDSLYLYGDSDINAVSVRQAIYDGPIDNRSYGYQAVILEKLPSVGDGDAVVNAVPVGAGALVVDNDNEVVTLNLGEWVRPAGCRSADCAIEFSGGSLLMDQMVVTFELLPGLKWSDGITLTADDSLYSFELDAHPDTPSDKYNVERTASYVALDEERTRWTGLPGYLDSTFMRRFWHPLPRHAWGHLTAAELVSAESSTRTPLGWGPYAIQTWESGVAITLTANPHYHRAGEGLPAVDTLIIRFTGDDPGGALGRLVAGELDTLTHDNGLDSWLDLLLVLEAEGLVNAHLRTGTTWEHAGFGIDSKDWYAATRPDFFEDGDMRRAIAYCLDRQAATDEVQYGYSPVIHTYIPPEHPVYPGDENLSLWPHSVASGTALLEAMGWSDQNLDGVRECHSCTTAGANEGDPLAFDWLSTDAPLRVQYLQMFRDDLAECGFDVTTVNWPAPEIWGPIFQREFDVASFAWLSGIEPPCEPYLSSQIPSDENGWNGANNTGFSDPDYDAACNQARTSLPGTAEYVAGHQEAMRLLSEKLPMVPLFLRVRTSATHPRLLGFLPDSTEQSDLYNVEEWALLVDGLPPEGSLQAGDGSQSSDTATLTLHLDAADYGGGHVTQMLLRERTWDGAAWAVVAETGWVAYAATYPWTLEASSGAHYLSAYFMDDSGNVSQLPARTVVNYTPASTAIVAEEVHVYRLRMGAGEAFTATLDTLSGDADLYVWAPRSEGEPDAYSNLGGTAQDQVVMTDTVEGDYHVEVHGFDANSAYHLDLEAPGLPLSLRGAPAARPQAPTAKVLPLEPATVDVPDDTPAEAPGGYPAALDLRSALTRLLPGGDEAQLTAEVWDQKGDHVADGKEVTFTTTQGHWAASGTNMVVAETTGGLVRVTLVSSEEKGVATVTATADEATDTLVFTFRRPYQVYLPLVRR